MYNLLENLLLAASSIAQGKFVAAKTRTLASVAESLLSCAVALDKADHWISSSVLILLDDSFSLSDLAVNRESISSMK